MSLSTLITAAQSAIESKDWSTAENALMRAQAELIQMPDSEDGEQSLRWSRATVNDLLREVRRHRTAKVGIQKQNVFPQPVDVELDC